MEKTAAIIQARMESTRLPGKVLRKIGGKTILAHVVSRVGSSRLLDEVWIATTDRPADDAIEAEARDIGVHCFRGSQDDVLARYHGAATAAEAAVIVRVTGDCPFFDGTLLDSMLTKFLAMRRETPPVDFMSNFLERRFPRGLDAEILTFHTLDRLHRIARQPNEREHVTPYVYHHPTEFQICSFAAEQDRSAIRWTLDTEEDWRFLEEILPALLQKDSPFTTQDVLSLLAARPELTRLNEAVEQRYSAEQ